MGKPETMTFRAVDTDPGPLLALGSLLPSLPDTPKIDGAGGQETFKQLRGEIAHAARLSILGELTASIAHEVIQPLTAIGSNIEAMQLLKFAAASRIALAAINGLPEAPSSPLHCGAPPVEAD